MTTTLWANPWAGLGGRAEPPPPTPRAIAQDLPEDASLAARMRHVLSVQGPMTSVALSRAVGLASASLVGALLKHDRAIGRVSYCDGIWEIEPDYEESHAAQIAHAAAVLRRAGWTVKSPDGRT